MKLYLFKKNGTAIPISGPILVPANEDVVESLKRIKENTYLSAEIKSPRNGRFHNKFFQMLRFVVDNQDVYPNTKMLLSDLKLWLGLYRLLVLPSGKPMYEPESISFAEMDNDSFSRFYSESVDALMLHVMAKIDSKIEMNRQMDILLSFT